MTLFVVSFIAGVLTVLAPCVLPLLPVILAGSVSETKNRRRPFIIIASLSLSVLAFTLLLKGSTALIGASPIFWNYVSAVILAAFGLTLLFPIAWARLVLKIPGHNKPDRWISKGYGKESSVWSDIIVGAALGPVFTTCSPTFFVILATVLPQSFAMGIIDLLAYILGLALVLLLVAGIGQRIIDRLEWATNPTGWFKRVLGALFIILAVLIAFGADKKIETAILNAGFFDVTRIEQSIHQALEDPRALPSSGLDQSQSGTIQSASSTSEATVRPGYIPPQKSLGKYIELVKIAGFINSEPFKLADLVGKKVILVDFVDYTCINCQRTFPYLNDWYAKYKDQGLEIVAIHTPEFSFEKDIANVRMGIAQFSLKFPVVLDNDYATWNAYRNQYWPHKYIIDIHGNVVYDHIGEGGYPETEAEIVQLLKERKQVLNETGSVTMGTSTMPVGYQILTQSPETYFGSLRNELFGNRPSSFDSNKGIFTIPDTLKPNMFYLGGNWNIENEYAETQSSSTQISYVFTATNMYVVAQSPNNSGSSGTANPVSAQILIDGKPIPEQWAGKDVSKDGMLILDQSRLYHLYSNTGLMKHRIDIIFSKPGVRVFTFTFG